MTMTWKKFVARVTARWSKACADLMKAVRSKS
jgi:hypothetical protein